MNKQDVIDFFDKQAPRWDADMVRNEEVISSILTFAGVKEGVDVLDVACGTGVLFEDYIKRGVRSLTAIDVSPKMVQIAREKYPDINVICGDVENTKFDKKFDVVMVYNAFPHFPEPQRLIATLADLVKTGGRLSVAHSMSREALHEHHKYATSVSIELPEVEELKDIFSPYFDVDVAISTEKSYQVSGIRKE